LRSNKVNYLVVGTFVIVMMVGIVIAVAWLTTPQWLKNTVNIGMRSVCNTIRNPMINIGSNRWRVAS